MHLLHHQPLHPECREEQDGAGWSSPLTRSHLQTFVLIMCDFAHLLGFLPGFSLIALFRTDKLAPSHGAALTQGSETLPASVTLISPQVGVCNY